MLDLPSLLSLIELRIWCSVLLIMDVVSYTSQWAMCVSSRYISSFSWLFQASMSHNFQRHGNVRCQVESYRAQNLNTHLTTLVTNGVNENPWKIGKGWNQNGLNRWYKQSFVNGQLLWARDPCTRAPYHIATHENQILCVFSSKTSI